MNNPEAYMMNKIREIRFYRGFTQDDIYLKTKIWPSRLSRIERGVFEPTEKEKELISRALEVPADEIFPE